MVNTRREPVFDLDQFRTAVKAGRWRMTRRATTQAEALGYPIKKVRAILLSLTTDDFSHVWELKDDKRKPILQHGSALRYDVYQPIITAPNGEECEVYLKVSLGSDGNVEAIVQSFHLPER